MRFDETIPKFYFHVGCIYGLIAAMDNEDVSEITAAPSFTVQDLHDLEHLCQKFHESTYYEAPNLREVTE